MHRARKGALVLAAVMSMSLVAACGDDSDGDTGQVEESPGGEVSEENIETDDELEDDAEQ